MVLALGAASTKPLWLLQFQSIGYTKNVHVSVCDRLPVRTDEQADAGDASPAEQQ